MANKLVEVLPDLPAFCSEEVWLPSVAKRQLLNADRRTKLTDLDDSLEASLEHARDMFSEWGMDGDLQKEYPVFCEADSICGRSHAAVIITAAVAVLNENPKMASHAGNLESVLAVPGLPALLKTALVDASSKAVRSPPIRAPVKRQRR